MRRGRLEGRTVRTLGRRERTWLGGLRTLAGSGEGMCKRNAITHTREYGS